MFSDDQLIPISALQHLIYCARQCTLIHVEGVWRDNRVTSEGNVMHRKAHSMATRMEDGILAARGLRLVSYRLGLVGMADVIEFHPTEEEALGAELPGRDQLWRAWPVEYKRGKPKPHNADKVQLCAQAMCLEEMLCIKVPRASLFYGRVED